MYVYSLYTSMHIWVPACVCVCVRGHYEDVRATLLPHTVMFLYIFPFFLGCCRCGSVACYIHTHTHTRTDTHTVTHWDTLARHTNDLYECLPRSLTSSAVAFASSHTHTHSHTHGEWQLTLLIRHVVQHALKAYMVGVTELVGAGQCCLCCCCCS